MKFRRVPVSTGKRKPWAFGTNTLFPSDSVFPQAHQRGMCTMTFVMNSGMLAADDNTTMSVHIVNTTEYEASHFPFERS
ncbi:hypothetical protein PENTCL1PPCAC_14623, partial [Pristionchus entomophagus]